MVLPFYDKKANKWLTTKEWSSKMQAKVKSNPLMNCWSMFGNLAPIVFILLIILIFVLQKKNKRYIDYAQEATKKSLELNEDGNRILKEILEVLKSKGQ